MNNEVNVITNNNNFNIPILFIIFNRTKTTPMVLESIRQIKPKKIYVAADGPRENKSGEKELCEQTRQAVINGIDWDCEVKKLFRKKNLGCGLGVSTAISWFFENEEMGIILEDDCLPNQNFFKFCADLLEYYKNDDRIAIISGNNFQNGQKRGDASYYFSYFFSISIWGWASWRRVWKDFHYKTSELNEADVIQAIEDMGLSKKIKEYWKKIFNIMNSDNCIDTWDYQFTFSQWVKKRFSIQPNVNLIKNLGYLEQGTHESGEKRWSISHSNLKLPLQYAEDVKVCIKADKWFCEKYLLLNTFEWIKYKYNPFRLLKRIKQKILRFK